MPAPWVIEPNLTAPLRRPLNFCWPRGRTGCRPISPRRILIRKSLPCHHGRRPMLSSSAPAHSCEPLKEHPPGDNSAYIDPSTDGICSWVRARDVPPTSSRQASPSLARGPRPIRASDSPTSSSSHPSIHPTHPSPATGGGPHPGQKRYVPITFRLSLSRPG